MKKWATLWLLLGEQYFVLEAIWRACKGERAHIAMLAVGGLCGIAVGAVNQIPRFYRLKVVWQCLIGTAVTLCVEFASGCILNLWLGLGIWSYANVPLNLLGQICVPFAGIWFCLMPFAIWLEDIFRFKFWGEGEAYTLRSIYRELIDDLFGWLFGSRSGTLG